MQNKYNLPGIANKKILVTGATGAIGMAVVKLLIEQQADVWITGRNTAKLRTVSEQFHLPHNKSISADLTDENQVKSLCEALSSLDGVVHCAGTMTQHNGNLPISDEVMNLFRVHVSTLTLLHDHLIRPEKLASGASVVAISSVASAHPFIGGLGYSAAKAALEAVVRALARELAPKKIRVNSLVPGKIVSEMGKSLYQPIETQYPLGEGLPADVAWAAAFLLSDAARWITGTSLVVDGGVSLNTL